MVEMVVYYDNVFRAPANIMVLLLLRPANSHLPLPGRPLLLLHKVRTDLVFISAGQFFMLHSRPHLVLISTSSPRPIKLYFLSLFIRNFLRYGGQS